MRRIVTALATVFAVAALCGFASAGQTAKAEPTDKASAKVADGKPIFTKYKCRACHSVEAEGITRKAVGEVVEEKGKQKPPDLSGVGLVHKAEWIGLFLQKKEKLDGKLHEKKFRGAESELQQLTAWLETLKDEAAAKKLKAGESKSGK